MSGIVRRIAHIFEEGKELKRCCRCKKALPLAMFGTQRRAWDGLQNSCAPCKHQYEHTYQNDNRKRINEITACAKRKLRKARYEVITSSKKQGCSICGYNRCFAALEYHHVNGDKEIIVARLRDSSPAKIQQEIGKCIVLCANCHREIHHITPQKSQEVHG